MSLSCCYALSISAALAHADALSTSGSKQCKLHLQDAALKLRSREFFAEDILVSPEGAGGNRSQTYGELQKLLALQRFEAQALLDPVPGPSEAGFQALNVSGMNAGPQLGSLTALLQYSNI